MMIDEKILKKLNTDTKERRLAALEEILPDTVFPPRDPRYINNHIHSTYSFSPYSPAAAAFVAKANGLCTAGIMDHDSMGGAEEFIRAGDIIGIPTTVGIEFRVDMKGTPLENRRTNNPDQTGCSYMTLHGVPHGQITKVQAHFAPLREKRNSRNRKMLERINTLCAEEGISLSFVDDVLPLSQYHEGGSVTERHLMFSLAKAILTKAGRGESVIALLGRLGVILSEKQKKLLLDSSGPYEYDLTGILKSAFMPKVYIPAKEECMSLDEAVAFGKTIDGILCYPYLGDVEDSVTGDKAVQRFEDDFLEELFDVLRDHCVRAITYMPARNTRDQLLRLRTLCERFGMYQISGEDINSPRQEFVCKAMEDPLFGNLIEAAWALIKHERGRKKIIL